MNTDDQLKPVPFGLSQTQPNPELLAALTGNAAIPRAVAYSANDEVFSYEDPEEAIQELADGDGVNVGDVYYAIDIEYVDYADYLDAADILESAENNLACDLGSETAEDRFAASDEAIAELQAAINAWADKHLTTRCWRCVGKSRELLVTADDIAALAR